MKRAYPFYDLDITFGVIASGPLTWNTSGSDIICGAQEAVKKLTIPGPVADYSSETVLLSSANEAEQITHLTYRAGIIAAGTCSGSIRLHRPNTCHTQVSWRAHKGYVTALKIDRAASRVASAGSDGDIKIWDCESCVLELHLLGHSAAVTTLRYTKDDMALFSCSKDGSVRVWNLLSKHCCHTIIPASCEEILDMDLTPADDHMVCCTRTKVLIFGIYPKAQYSEFQSTLLFEFACANAVALTQLSACGEWLGILSRNRNKLELHQWETLTGKHDLKCTTKGLRLNLAVQRRPLQAPVPGKKVPVKCSLPLPAHCIEPPSRLHCFAFCPTKERNKIIRIATSLMSNNIEIYEFDCKQGSRLFHTFRSHGHRSALNSISLSADETLLATCSMDQMKIWSSHSGVCLHTHDVSRATCCAFAFGTHILIGTHQGQIELVNHATGEIVDQTQGHAKTITNIYAFPSRDGFLSSSRDQTIKQWVYTVNASLGGSTRLSLCVARTVKLQNAISTMCVSTNSKFVACALSSCSVEILFADHFSRFLTLHGHTLPVFALDISSDNLMLASGGADKTLRVWGLTFGECILKCSAHDGCIQAIKFVPHTHYLSTAGQDKSIKLWDIDTQTQIMTLTGHQAEISSLCVSANDARIYSCSKDYSIRKWCQTSSAFDRDCHSTAYFKNPSMTKNGFRSPQRDQSLTLISNNSKRSFTDERGQAKSEPYVRFIKTLLGPGVQGKLSTTDKLCKELHSLFGTQSNEVPSRSHRDKLCAETYASIVNTVSRNSKSICAKKHARACLKALQGRLQRNTQSLAEVTGLNLVALAQLGSST
mmetsp:Transcript_10982/g.38106  ORF Transcript_10982/g.38106 Transcript_10982/m.38106 type:complete len:823 (-) Transcript_10982:2452-4920(-)